MPGDHNIKVKIGDTIYDSEEEPIMVILTPMDKLMINAMPPHLGKYVVFPTSADIRLIEQWMAEVPGFAIDEQ